jgi:hypothetical protein
MRHSASGPIVILDPASPGVARNLNDLSIATQAPGLQLQPLEVRELDHVRARGSLKQRPEIRWLLSAQMIRLGGAGVMSSGSRVWAPRRGGNGGSL